MLSFDDAMHAGRSHRAAVAAIANPFLHPSHYVFSLYRVDADSQHLEGSAFELHAVRAGLKELSPV